MPTTPKLPDDIDALKTALIAERAARQQAAARASGAEAMVAHLKLLIAKMKRGPERAYCPAQIWSLSSAAKAVNARTRAG